MGVKAPEIVRAVTCLFLPITYITVGLRCYVRIFIVKAFGADDWFSLASLVSWTVYSVSTLMGASRGVGEHMVDLPADLRADGQIANPAKYWWICEIAYVVSSAALKASVGFMLLHFVLGRKRIATWAILGFVFAYSVAFFFFIIFQCNPPGYFWEDQVGKSGTCLPPAEVGVFSIVYSIINALADLYFAIMPCFVVRDLQMSRKPKLYVAGILGLGGIASCAVVVRVPYLLILLHNYLDFLDYTVNVVNWSTTELGLGITAAALATLRPLFQNLRHGFSGFSISDGTGLPRSSKARANSAGYIQSSDGSEAIRMDRIKKKATQRIDDLEAFPIEASITREASQRNLVESYQQTTSR